MTVKELIFSNAFIVDIEVEIRENGSLLKGYYAIGPDAGDEPPYPTYADNKKGTYVRKSINAFDDGKEYWETKLKRIPDYILNLEVFQWSTYRPFMDNHTHKDRNGSAVGIRITALPDGPMPSVSEEKTCDNAIEGQTDIFDFIGGTK